MEHRFIYVQGQPGENGLGARWLEMRERMVLPKVGLFACFSGGSNTGSLTGMAALEAVERLGSEELLADKGIVPDVYLNLEKNLHLAKHGPFSSLAFDDYKVTRVADAIVAAVNRCLAGLEARSKKVKLNLLGGNQGWRPG
jgi:hypothetical protein